MFSRPVSEGVKAGADLEQARDPTLNGNPPFARLGNAREDFEQRALAGAVAADDAEHLAALDLEADIPERPELLDRVASEDGAAARHVRRLAPEVARAARHHVAQRDVALALGRVAD